MHDGDEFKERVREATDIAAIIGQYVTLKKRGKNLTGLCPFHTEKTPSFTVHADRHFFHCFGCGKGGDVYSFLMEHESWSFPEALKYLAEKAGIPLPQRRKPEDSDRYSRLLDANAAAAEFFAWMIEQPEGQAALNYITGRGIEKKRLRELGIGFAPRPSGWDGLIKFCSRRKISERDLIDAGLAIKHEKTGRVYDRFRLRLTFAIANLSGLVVGFGARALEKDETAKYINSPETPVYQKSRLLYGLHHAREAIRQADYSVVVEGYTDRITLAQAGIGNVVASSGTAFTAEQARLLARFSRRVVLLFDADVAGQRAALRGVEVLFAEGLEVKIAALPAGTDPDTALRTKGKDFLQQTLAEAQGYVQFRVGQSREEMHSGGLLQQEALIKELLATAGAVQDRVRRALLVRQIAEASGLSEADLTQQLTGRRATRPEEPAVSGRPRKIFAQRVETEFLALLLTVPAYLKEVKVDIFAEDFRDPTLGAMYRELINLEPAPAQIQPADLGSGPEEKDRWLSLASVDLGPETSPEVLADFVRRIAGRRSRSEAEKLKQAIKDAEGRGEADEAQRLLRILQEKHLTKGNHKSSI